MINGLIRFAVSQRLLVMLMVAIMIGAGIYSFQQLPIDAVPDVTNVQVQVLTAAPSLAPLEVERQITFHVEVAMSGHPKADVLQLFEIAKERITKDRFHAPAIAGRARARLGTW